MAGGAILALLDNDDEGEVIGEEATSDVVVAQWWGAAVAAFGDFVRDVHQEGQIFEFKITICNAM